MGCVQSTGCVEALDVIQYICTCILDRLKHEIGGLKQ